MDMNRATFPNESPPRENLLVIESNGRILSRTVSQVYGRALLGALALRLNSLPFKILHESHLPQHELWTLDNIRKAAQAKASRVNLIFINDNRKILSCRINPNYGMALLRTLQETPEEASRVLSRPHTQGNSNDHEAMMESHQHDDDESHQIYASNSSSPLSMSGTPARIMAILPDQVLSSANRQPYDRDWMEIYHVNEDCLSGTPSKHKLDVLLRYGAVKVGDRLCIEYHPDSGPVELFGEVSSRQAPSLCGHDANFRLP